jgi:hypothetical protein
LVDREWEEKMDYGKLFSRAWDIIWKYKFLILLGVLVALGSAGGNGGSNPGQYAFNGNEFDWQDWPRFEYGSPFRGWDLPVLAVGGIALVVLVFFLFGAVLWVLSTISRGGLIHAVNEIELGNPTDFSDAFRAGWQKGWRLIGIGVIPLIPGLLLLISGLISLGAFGGFEALTRGDFHLAGLGIFLPLIILAAIFVPVMLILSLLSNFANRACMLDDQDVLDAYRRGFKVLGDNLGPAVVLFLLQIALSIGIGIMMLIPGILIALCCLLWPLFLLIQGAFKAYYSTLWTLAWREWTESALLASEVESESTDEKKN